MNGDQILRGAGLATLAVLQMASANTAHAQNSGQAPREVLNSSDIIVTAQKRSQKLQDVAGSISAVSSEQLELTGSRAISEITSQTPGLVWGEKDGLAFATVRGVGLSIENGVASPNVAVHVDGVFLARPTMATLNGEDLERVEVLRGPQGTLYGRNATGGAINMISKAPTSTWSGGAKFGYGNYDTVTASAFVSGPLAEATSFRVSGSYKNRGDGFYQNVFTGNDENKLREYTFRGAIQSQLNETTVADLSVLYQHTDFQAQQQTMHPFGPVALAVIPALATAVTTSKPYTVASDYPGDSTRSTLLIRGGLTFDISDDVQLKSITAYIDHKVRQFGDGDQTSASINYWHDYIQPSESFTQEFNVGGRGFDGKLDWLVGAYYFHEKYLNDFPLELPQGFPGLYSAGPVSFRATLHEKTDSYAGFTDVTYSLMPRLRVYAGARYAHEVKKMSSQLDINAIGVASLVSCPSVSNPTYDTFSPRVGLQVDVADKVMAYAQFQKGFKSGGLNSASCSDPFDPEKLKAYEAGFKSTLFDNALVFNASAFYYDYRDLQIFKFSAFGGTIENADARIYGAEFEARFRPSRIFELDVASTLLNAKYKDFLTLDLANPAAGVQNFRGNRLDRSPKYVVTVSPQLNLPVSFATFDTVAVRGDVRFSGKFFFGPSNAPDLTQKAYTTVDVSASLGGDTGMSIRAFAKNLTNKAAISTIGFTPVTFGYTGTYAPPRTYGVEVGFKF